MTSEASAIKIKGVGRGGRGSISTGFPVERLMSYVVHFSQGILFCYLKEEKKLGKSRIQCRDSVKHP